MVARDSEARDNVGGDAGWGEVYERKTKRREERKKRPKEKRRKKRIEGADAPEIPQPRRGKWRSRCHRAQARAGPGIHAAERYAQHRRRRRWRHGTPEPHQSDQPEHCRSMRRGLGLRGRGFRTARLGHSETARPLGTSCRAAPRGPATDAV